MMLRRTYDNEWTKETPKFVVLLPGVAFKVYQVLRSDTAPPILAEIQSIGFRVSYSSKKSQPYYKLLAFA